MGRQIKLHPHQSKALSECHAILVEDNVCYLAGDVRTGKTLVALHCAGMFGNDVLFVTKKMAIASIEQQFREANLRFNLTVTNYEQLKYIDQKYDTMILDEAHTLGAFPKPSKRARQLRILLADTNTKCILLSGTPSPESFSQLFHQLWCVWFQPWAKYTNFYKWAKDFVNVKKVHYAAIPFNDYTEAYWDRIQPVLDPITVRMTQEGAKFKGSVYEKVHTVTLDPRTHAIIRAVVKDGVHDKLKLAALNAAQKMSYVHQLCSGTVIDSEQRSRVVDRAKVNYIIEQWCTNYNHANPRLAIFYCYVAEGLLLRETFPRNTNSPEEFAKDPRLTFICQIKAGSMGTDLRAADVLIFYNIDYSAASYFQARARQQHRDAKDVTVHWLFSDYGYERKVYNVIHNGKKKYTLSHFRKDYTVPDGPQIAFGGMVRHKVNGGLPGRRTGPHSNKKR